MKLDPSKILKLAKWEVLKNKANINRHSIILIILISIILSAILVTDVGNIGYSNDLYRIGVSKDDKVVYDAVNNDKSLKLVETNPSYLRIGKSDVLIRDGSIQWRKNDKGLAALKRLKEAVNRQNTFLMLQEGDSGFPVRVNMIEIERDLQRILRKEQGYENPQTGSNNQNDQTSDSESSDDQNTEGTNDQSSENEDPSIPPQDSDFVTNGEEGSGLSSGAGSNIKVPENLEPPFPFKSLILVLSFVLPLSFVMQSYGNSLLEETTNERGELLLVSPASGLDLLIGKTLPYFIVSLLISLGIILISNATFLSLFYFLPVIFAYLALTLYVSFISRSFKEMSFLSISGTILLSIYVFIPAIFMEIPSISLISPLSLVIRSIEGNTVTFMDYVVSSVPLYLGSLAVFTFSHSLFRNETLFSNISISDKILKSLRYKVRDSYLGTFKVVLLLVPLVFMIELLLMGSIFSFDPATSIIVSLVVVAVVEELFKSIPVYSVARETNIGLRKTLLMGLVAGIAFFVGEKITILASLSGLHNISPGKIIFSSNQGLLFFLPAFLHIGTTVIGVSGSSKNRRFYWLTLGLAIVIHFLYDYGLVVLLGNV